MTALAVLNFVFAGLGLIGSLGMLTLLGAADRGGEFDRSLAQAGSTAPSKGAIYAVLLVGLAASAIMLVAGVGYIKQKRFLGRTMGNVYVVLSLASTVMGIVLLHSGFGLFSIIGLVYPVLTAILINGTFKDDLVQ
ncbi:MAG: hypothetical protein WKG01_38605 [Kofleriaceae bacterium]